MTYRICWIGSHSQDGKRYRSVAEHLAPRFERDGHTVTLASRARGRLAKLKDIRSTLKDHEAYDVAIIDVFSTAALWYARLGARWANQHGKPLVLLLHGGHLPILAKHHPRRLRRLLQRAGRIVTPSAFLDRTVCRPLGHKPTYIPNPVSLEAFPHRQRERAHAKLLWVRAFREHYRPQDAVHALARLMGRYPEATLAMAGPDHGALKWTRALAEKLEVQDAVSYLGVLTPQEVARAAADCDVFLNTSTIDNAPLSIIEALSMGLCVVSTDVGGIPDLVEDGVNALLVPPARPDATADAVSQIIDEPRFAARLSRAGGQAAARHDADRIAGQWNELLGALLAPSSPRGATS